MAETLEDIVTRQKMYDDFILRYLIKFGREGTHGNDGDKAYGDFYAKLDEEYSGRLFPARDGWILFSMRSTQLSQKAFDRLEVLAHDSKRTTG